MNLPPDCSLPHIGGVHREAIAALGTSDRIEMDASGVIAADVSFVQLVVSASRSAADAGGTLVITGLAEQGRALFLRAGIEIDPAGAVFAN